MKALYGKLYNRLPLPTNSFAGFDVANAQGEPGATVVAEIILRVPDAMHPHLRRVDLFVYKENGDVIRYHPGRTPREDMVPHCMPYGSVCFNLIDAWNRGVGATLHQQPPGMVEHANLGAAQPLSLIHI